MFFVLGANNDAIKLVAINVVIGCAAALVCIVMVHAIKKFPDFWGISLSVGILAFVLVMSQCGLGPRQHSNDIRGLRRYVSLVAGDRRRRLVRRSGDAHASRRRADARQGRWRPSGAGAFFGVLSTPYGFVVLNCFATMFVGLGFGVASARIAAVLTPSPAGGGGRRARRRRAPHDRLIDVQALGPGVDS